MMTTTTMRNFCKAMNIAIRGANCQRQYGGFLLPTRTNLKIIPAERQIIQFIVRCKAVLHFILILWDLADICQNDKQQRV